MPATSLQYRVSTIIVVDSVETHGINPLPVHVIAMSSAFTPPMGYGAISW